MPRSAPVRLDIDRVVATLRRAGCVYAEDEAELLVAAATSAASSVAPSEVAAPSAAGELARMLAQRVAGMPLEHILGWAEFCGLRIAVGPGVFVPRRRTEFLAARAIALVREAGPGALVVDLCCGAGAVAAAVVAAEPSVEVHAADIDPVAVDYARRNLPGRADCVHVGDLVAPLPAALHGRIDVITANTPYVPTREIDLLPAEARLYEPRTALDGGDDGLDLHRRLAAEAPPWLAPGGHVLVEASEEQAPVTARLFAAAGLAARVVTAPELAATVVIGGRVRVP